MGELKTKSPTLTVSGDDGRIADGDRVAKGRSPQRQQDLGEAAAVHKVYVRGTVGRIDRGDFPAVPCNLQRSSNSNVEARVKTPLLVDNSGQFKKASGEVMDLQCQHGEVLGSNKGRQKRKKRLALHKYDERSLEKVQMAIPFGGKEIRVTVESPLKRTHGRGPPSEFYPNSADLAGISACSGRASKTLPLSAFEDGFGLPSQALEDLQSGKSHEKVGKNSGSKRRKLKHSHGRTLTAHLKTKTVDPKGAGDAVTVLEAKLPPSTLLDKGKHSKSNISAKTVNLSIQAPVVSRISASASPTRHNSSPRTPTSTANLTEESPSHLQSDVGRSRNNLENQTVVASVGHAVGAFVELDDVEVRLVDVTQKNIGGGHFDFPEAENNPPHSVPASSESLPTNDRSLTNTHVVLEPCTTVQSCARALGLTFKDITVASRQEEGNLLASVSNVEEKAAEDPGPGREFFDQRKNGIPVQSVTLSPPSRSGSPIMQSPPLPCSIRPPLQNLRKPPTVPRTGSSTQVRPVLALAAVESPKMSGKQRSSNSRDDAFVEAVPINSRKLSLEDQMEAVLSKFSPSAQAENLRKRCTKLSDGVSGSPNDGGGRRGAWNGRKGGSPEQMANDQADVVLMQKKRAELAVAEKAREEEAIARVSQINKQLEDLEAKKNSLLGTGTPPLSRENPLAQPSPRESRKGQKSRATNHGDLQLQVKKVTDQFCAGNRRAPSTDSCTVDGSGNFISSNPNSLGTWEPLCDAPVCEVNLQMRPIGLFWDHMRLYAFERGKQVFEWKNSWHAQPRMLKMRFKMRLKQLYPGEWDEVWVMQQVGNNLRETRSRLRKLFWKYKKMESVPLPVGLSEDSFQAIYDSLSDPKYQSKSDKCRRAADERTRRKGFTHKLGPGGVKGLLRIFEDEFCRLPDEGEIYFAKRNGVPSLLEQVRGKVLALPMPLTEKTKVVKEKRKATTIKPQEEEEEEFESGESSDEEQEPQYVDKSDDSSDSDSPSEESDGEGSEQLMGNEVFDEVTRSRRGRLIDAEES